jgi:hypothetical protein
MYKWLIGIVTGLTLYELSKSVAELPGTSTIEPSDDSPRTVGDLKKEIPDLSPIISEVFKEAVELHLNRKYEEALNRYNKCEELSKEKSSSGLYQHSKVFRHNYDLVKKQVDKAGSSAR